MQSHSLDSAVGVGENCIIGETTSPIDSPSLTILSQVLVSIINLGLLVLLSVVVEASNFLVFPLVVEWFTLVIVVLYLLVRESRRGTSASLMFGAQFILGLALTSRAWLGSALCNDFGNMAHSCRVALAVVALSWLSTSTAFAGILLSCVGPLHRFYLAHCMPRRPKIKPSEHVIKLVNMPTTYQASHNTGKEEWTEIPV
ncbi:hypothetical protein B0H13DRAFT_1850017 [Mycena leptocephala]|nr:hypothetical protein B0H13DRAFT_1850017 [Mycena leptocephala]